MTCFPKIASRHSNQGRDDNSSAAGCDSREILDTALFGCSSSSSLSCGRMKLLVAGHHFLVVYFLPLLVLDLVSLSTLKK